MPTNKSNQGGKRPILWKVYDIDERNWEQHKQMERCTMFMNIVKMYIPPKTTYKFNPSQNIHGIFHRNRINNFKICMKPQKTMNRQSNLEKEQSWGYHISWFKTILQSYGNQNRMGLAQTHRLMEQNRELINKPIFTLPISLWQWRQKYKLEKIQYLQ